MNLICLLKTIYLNLDINTLLNRAYISGHDYVEQKNGNLKCKICGDISK